MKWQHALGLALAATLAAPASAAIRCDGSYQINSQGEFGSLYCEEENLAKVARSHGVRVTAAQIRASYSLQGDVCRQVGNDISVADICGQFVNHSRHCDLMFPC